MLSSSFALQLLCCPRLCFKTGFPKTGILLRMPSRGNKTRIFSRSPWNGPWIPGPWSHKMEKDVSKWPWQPQIPLLIVYIGSTQKSVDKRRKWHCGKNSSMIWRNRQEYIHQFTIYLHWSCYNTKIPCYEELMKDRSHLHGRKGLTLMVEGTQKLN